MVPEAPLTAPWKDLGLPVDGGVVELSWKSSVTVVYPATPYDVARGLHLSWVDALVKSGATLDLERRAWTETRTLTEGEDAGLVLYAGYSDYLNLPGGGYYFVTTDAFRDAANVPRPTVTARLRQTPPASRDRTDQPRESSRGDAGEPWRRASALSCLPPVRGRWRNGGDAWLYT